MGVASAVDLVMVAYGQFGFGAWHCAGMIGLVSAMQGMAESNRRPSADERLVDVLREFRCSPSPYIGISSPRLDVICVAPKDSILCVGVVETWIDRDRSQTCTHHSGTRIFGRNRIGRELQNGTANSGLLLSGDTDVWSEPAS